MTGFRFLVPLVVLLPAVTSLGQAAPQNWLRQEPEFLPVEQAFVLSTEIDGDGALVARWEIAEGYYLYRHRFAFEAADGAGARLGDPEIPAGLVKVDEYFGEVEVYYQAARTRVPVEPEGGPLQVGIGYQGCADAGLCYPPQTQWVSLHPADGAVTYLVSKKR